MIEKLKNKPSKRLGYWGAVATSVLLFAIGAIIFGGFMSYQYGFPINELQHTKYQAASVEAVMYGALSFLPGGLTLGLFVGVFGVGLFTLLFNNVSDKKKRY